MRQSKVEFFSKGVNEQKTPDVIIDLKRIDEKKIKEWSREEKNHAIDFMADAENRFKKFKNELSRLLK